MSDYDWKENPHAMYRKIPKDVEKWVDEGLPFEILNEGSNLPQRYEGRMSAVLCFIGPGVISHYRLAPPMVKANELPSYK